MPLELWPEVSWQPALLLWPILICTHQRSDFGPAGTLACHSPQRTVLASFSAEEISSLGTVVWAPPKKKKIGT